MKNGEGRARRWLSAVAMAAALPMLGGCVIGDIHDELMESTRKLDTVAERLGTTNELLTKINTRLDETAGELASVKQDLGATNRSIADLQGRLATLDSISTTLDRVDDSLRTVKVLIEKIPLVGEDVKDQAAEEKRK